ncbi:biotin/lipoyl-binding protein [Thalassobius vesicularis]|uniref:Biotin/lipoyl-binding protein n=1 Tax=Thalassobius vesicularis TaxID=1294297 RepID=A0A4S3M4Y5_9RHOB|nr:biotin/lipoyl-binding protein [Thalassobius vesicularis]
MQNSQAVAEGDPLFRIDPEPYQLQMQQARAGRAQSAQHRNPRGP